MTPLQFYFGLTLTPSALDLFWLRSNYFRLMNVETEFSESTNFKEMLDSLHSLSKIESIWGIVGVDAGVGEAI